MATKCVGIAKTGTFRLPHDKAGVFIVSMSRRKSDKKAKGSSRKQVGEAFLNAGPGALVSGLAMYTNHSVAFVLVALGTWAIWIGVILVGYVRRKCVIYSVTIIISAIFLMLVFCLPGKEPTEWLLIPANEPDPFVLEVSPMFPIPPDAVKIFFGEDVAVRRKIGLVKVLRIGSEDIISAAFTPKGLYVNAHIWREDGRELGVIENNRFTCNQNNFYVKRPTMPDRHELRVYGKNGRLLWKVRYINERSVVFEGTFCAPGREPVIATRNISPFSQNPSLGGNIVMDMNDRDPNACCFGIQ